MKAIETLEDFVREEISECESILEACKGITKYEEMR